MSGSTCLCPEISKIKKFENPSTSHKFYVDLGPKRYFGPKDPIIGSMDYGGGGF